MCDGCCLITVKHLLLSYFLVPFIGHHSARVCDLQNLVLWIPNRSLAVFTTYFEEFPDSVKYFEIQIFIIIQSAEEVRWVRSYRHCSCWAKRFGWEKCRCAKEFLILLLIKCWKTLSVQLLKNKMQGICCPRSCRSST